MLRKSFFLLILSLCSVQCQQTATSREVAVERLTNFSIDNIRLYDGVPLGMDFNLHWQAEPNVFERFKVSADSFPKTILTPLAEEALRDFAHNFHSVDSVFFGQRDYFIQTSKDKLGAALQKSGISVQSIVLRSLRFPQTYVAAIEAAGLQRQEMERIRHQTAIAVAEAEGERRKTEAQSRIQIAQEEANARVRDIQASTETRRRAAEVERAETEVQIEAKKALIAADRQRQMDKVELDKMAQLNEINQKRTRETDQAELEKMAKLNELNQQKGLQSNEVELARNRELAKVYVENPTYAQFVVNKELAAKVNIAVLPAGQEQTVLGRFLEQKDKH